ncbi:hypothetical protein ERO13_D09G114266v2 [Gossypium hirsutum]|nr:hypothetical protein ERO13_D09G114266v2 [Gossypium hirsutum]
MASSSKKTRGKQKIEIKIIENEDDRLISFSKRRFGIYKKISELSTLCGCDILFIIFSPKGKPYSFAHPSIEAVTKRFLNPHQPLYETTDALVEAYRKVRIKSLVQDYNEVHDQLDASKEKQKAFSLAQQSCGSESHHWWKTPIYQLNPRELHELDKRFAEFINLISIARDKKIVSISSMHAAMDEDVPFVVPSRYGPSLHDILFIIFSPKGKPYSFAHPSTEFLTKRFLNPNQPLHETTDAPVEAYRKRSIHDQLDASKEKQKVFSLAQQSCGSESHHWWKTPIDQLNPREFHE